MPVNDLTVQLALAHQRLVQAGLVVWTMGNISVYDRSSDSVFIKPTGVPYPELDSYKMVRIKAATGEQMPWSDLKPSTDLESHLYVYQHWNRPPDINAIVHTHSPYATAFAVRGWDIPCIATSIADEFGGDIPCATYATIGTDEIGKAIIAELRDKFCSAVLLRQHGVFTFGTSIEKALKAAVMVEDAARVAYLALSMSHIDKVATLRLPSSEVEKAFHRYHTDYGQSK